MSNSPSSLQLRWAWIWTRYDITKRFHMTSEDKKMLQGCLANVECGLALWALVVGVKLATSCKKQIHHGTPQVKELGGG